ncbi:MAG: twin-arginine translocation signal domain-containing protein, partial [Myxococcaceae bacterium]
MGISRRKLVQVAGTATVGAALGAHRQVFAQGAKKKLKILQWNHFVPGYDKWFNGTYIKKWG